MAQLAAFSQLNFKGGYNVDILTTGPAARQAGVDRRTFTSWAKKLGIKPAAILEGKKAIYLKKDVDTIVKAIEQSRSKAK